VSQAFSQSQRDLLDMCALPHVLPTSLTIPADHPLCDGLSQYFQFQELKGTLEINKMLVKSLQKEA
jgi:hypothetical protein